MELFSSCKSLVKNDGSTVPVADLANTDVVAIYFSAHWCPPCRGFTPELVKIHEELTSAGKSFQVVFVSSDRDEEAFKEYFAEMPWLALPYEERELKESMSEAFGVNGIPSLVLLTGAGEEITREGRDAVGYGVAHFPWGEAERKAGAAAAEKAEEERAAEGKRKEEEMAAAQKEAGAVVFRRVRGELTASKVSEDYTVKFDGFNTVAAPGAKINSGSKGFYEIEVVQCGGIQQAGFASDRFDLTIDTYSGDGIGDDGDSWGIDGGRVCRWHEGDSEWGEKWADGDVIGCAADLETGRIMFGRNGVWTGAMGCAFEGDQVSAAKTEGGIFPAITAQGTTLRLNFGERTWKFGPPDATFSAVSALCGCTTAAHARTPPPAPPPSGGKVE